MFRIDQSASIRRLNAVAVAGAPSCKVWRVSLEQGISAVMVSCADVQVPRSDAEEDVVTSFMYDYYLCTQHLPLLLRYLLCDKAAASWKVWRDLTDWSLL